MLQQPFAEVLSGLPTPLLKKRLPCLQTHELAVSVSAVVLGTSALHWLERARTAAAAARRPAATHLLVSALRHSPPAPLKDQTHVHVLCGPWSCHQTAQGSEVESVRSPVLSTWVMLGAKKVIEGVRSPTAAN